MRQVRIVTDSTADVPTSLATELGISVVPLQVHLQDEIYRDGVDVLPETYYDTLARSSELPRTSQPPVGQFVETYRRLLEEEKCEAIVSVHLAGTLSGTVNAAWTAVQMLPDPSRVELIDTGQLSMGIGWIAIEAARAAKAGATLAQVKEVAESLLSRVRASAMIDNLENLRRGGRITLISAALGTALQIKPLVSIQGGAITVWGRVRTRSRAFKHLVEHVRGWGELTEMAILHTGAEELADSLADALNDLVPAERRLMLPAGAALTSHVGLGAVGVAALLAPDH